MDFFDDPMDKVFRDSGIKNLRSYKGTLNVSKLPEARHEGVQIEVIDDCLNIGFQEGRGAVGCYLSPSPLTPDHNYFEFKILKTGQNKTIAIGIAHRNYKLTKQPGWKKGSVGYHSDDGMLYVDGHSFEFGPECTKHDILGCGIDFGDYSCVQDMNPGDKIQVFFTRNLQEVGKRVWFPYAKDGLFPIVGLHSDGEKVSLRPSMLWTPTPPPMSVDSLDEDWHLLDDIVQRGDVLDYAVTGSERYERTGEKIVLAVARKPLDRQRHYFEVEILGTSRHGAVCIGLVCSGYPPSQMPGWKQKSVGYHSDDGKLFVGHGQGVDFGPQCEIGDRMGCGLRFQLQKWEQRSFSLLNDMSNIDESAIDVHQSKEEKSKLLKEEQSNDGDSSSFEIESSDSSEFKINSNRKRAVRKKVVKERKLSRSKPENACVRRIWVKEENELVSRVVPRDGHDSDYESSDSDSSDRSNIDDEVDAAKIDAYETDDSEDDQRAGCDSENSDDEQRVSIEVYFTKNGEEVGACEISLPFDGLYPAVGMLQLGDRVRYDLCPLSG